MKGLTFDSFITHDTNQAAYDACLRQARLEADAPRPLVLLGESNAGKSHLLWSVVNFFRENDMPIGVALISAQDFPAKVKRLAENPEKLEKGRAIVLLVDELHLFDADVAQLEDVVFAVYERGHRVIFATKVHPNVLPSLSGKFKALLNKGAIVGMKSLPRSEGAVIPEAALTQIAQLKSRVAELEAGTASQEPASVVSDDAEALDAALRRLSEAQEDRDQARATLERTQLDMETLREQLREVALEREQAQAEADNWKNNLNAILEKLATQKQRFVDRLAHLEQRAQDLFDTAGQLSSGRGEDQADLCTANEFNLAKAHQHLALQTAEIDELRNASSMLAEALRRRESDAHNVIATIRDTLTSMDIAPDGGANAGGTKPFSSEPGVLLKQIVKQLETLEQDLSEEPDDGPRLFPEMDAGDEGLETISYSFPESDSPESEPPEERNQEDRE